MPGERTHRSTTRYRDRRCNDPNYNTYIQDTLADIAANEYPSFRQASRATGIPGTTLTDRAKGRRDTWDNASAKQQLLSTKQEDTLVKWCELRASMSEAWSAADLRAQAEAIAGKAGRKMGGCVGATQQREDWRMQVVATSQVAASGCCGEVDVCGWMDKVGAQWTHLLDLPFPGLPFALQLPTPLSCCAWLCWCGQTSRGDLQRLEGPMALVWGEDLVGIPEDNCLNLSNGWLTQFKTRNGLKEVRQHGKAALANADTVEKERKQTQELIKKYGYGLRDIFNMDETGLFHGVKNLRQNPAAHIQQRTKALYNASRPITMPGLSNKP
ncbi:hypothetical protein B0H34DRAFT_670593 [Crassisporium funariophilum]|nr:hypothetical protein B0H34DRAFT_670593 [Crassisporium funariophilum]